MAYLTKEGLARVMTGIKARVLLKGSLSVAGYSFSPTTLAAGGAATLTKDVKRTGYTPVGIIGTDIRSSWAFACKATVSNGIATLSIRNTGTSGIVELTPAVWVLYVKD